MNKVTVTGKTVKAAIESGLQQLGATEDQVNIRIIEEPTKGLFGIGAKDAVVELERKIDALDEAVRFLDEVLNLMTLDVKIEKQQLEDTIQFNISGPELGLLIGRRGQTLDALQYLVNIVANRYSQERLRIILDAENFRSRRKKTLEQLALRLASRASKYGKEVILEPMPAMERKVIHSFLQEHPRVETYSKGDEPNRRVVIKPK